MKNAAEQTVKDHGYKEDIITQEIKEKIKSNIRRSYFRLLRSIKE